MTKKKDRKVIDILNLISKWVAPVAAAVGSEYIKNLIGL